MQQNFPNIGQEHSEAKEKIKELESEKISLEEQIAKLEQQIEICKSQTKSETSKSTILTLPNEILAQIFSRKSVV